MVIRPGAQSIVRVWLVTPVLLTSTKTSAVEWPLRNRTVRRVVVSSVTWLVQPGPVVMVTDTNEPSRDTAAIVPPMTRIVVLDLEPDEAVGGSSTRGVPVAAAATTTVDDDPVRCAPSGRLTRPGSVFGEGSPQLMRTNAAVMDVIVAPDGLTVGTGAVAGMNRLPAPAARQVPRAA